MRSTHTRPALTAALLAGALALAGCSAEDQEKVTDAASSAGAAVSSAAPSIGAAASSLASSAGPAVGSAASDASSAAASRMDDMRSKDASGSAAASGHAGHSMEHAMDGGPAPAGIEEADDPAYPVGTEVTLTADHMPGMKGAEATVTGAFDTTAYQVDYTPTDGGEKVTAHKWVVQEELEGVHDDDLHVGDTAVMAADHMTGMKGAEATISGISEETVSMVDVTTADGMTMKNHKWVVEDEVQPAR